VMTRDVLTASASETIATATQHMRDHKVGSVVVVDGRRPIGILTERDLVKIAAGGADPAIAKVSEWMTASPDTVSPDQDVIDAWKSLAEHGYRHIPVVSNDELQGIVSMRDLVKIAQIRPVEGPASPTLRKARGRHRRETTSATCAEWRASTTTAVQRGGAGREAAARRRVVSALRRRAAEQAAARGVP